MILIIDMNWKKKSLGYFEFVLPIMAITEKLDICFVRHFLEIKNQDLDQCDKVILSGTALKDTTTLSRLEKFQWLKETDKPVLGICAGMETIGMVYGMHLVKCLEIGMTQINTIKENSFVFGDFKAFSLHSYCIDASDDFEVWAKSSKCVQIIKHRIKPIYGALFHPEVRNQELIKRFIETK